MTLIPLKRKELILADAKERILKKNTLGVGYPLPKIKKTQIMLSALRENERKPSL